MSVTEQLIKAKNNLVKSRRAIVHKGGTVGEVAKFDNLPEEIISIPSGDSNYLLVTDTDTAYKKQILPGALPLMNLKSIGGMTYKSNQLLPTGYWEKSSQSGTYGGMTFTNHGDGSFTFDGTCDGAYIELFTVSWDNYPENFKKYSLYGDYLSFGATLPEGVNCVLYLDGGSDTGSGTTITGSGGLTGANATWRIAYISLNIPSGTVFNKLTIKPMLNYGTSALPYEPYFEGLRDSKATALKVYGANLFNPSICLNNNFIDNGDGTYTMKRNGNERFSAWGDLYIPANTKIYISGEIVSAGAGSVQAQFTLSDGSVDSSVVIDGSIRTYNFAKDIVKIRLFMQGTAASTPSEAIISNLMISYGKVPYYPYKAEPTVYALPEAVQNLPMFGHGVTDSQTKITYANTVDFENKQNRNYLPEKVVFDGVNVKATSVDKTGVYRALYNLPYATPSARALNITHFNVNDANTAGNAYLVGKNLVMCPSNQSLDTLTKFNAWLKEMYDAGTPVECVYAVATPEVTDISKELKGFDRLIGVEPTGVVEFVSERNDPIPSEISYLRRIT